MFHVSMQPASSGPELPLASYMVIGWWWMTKTTIPSTDPTLGPWRIEHSPCHAEDLQAFEVHKVERLEMPPTLEQCHVLSHMMQHHRPAQFLVLIDLTPKFRSHKVIKSVHKYLETSLVISSFSPLCLLVFCLCVTSIMLVFKQKTIIFLIQNSQKSFESSCFFFQSSLACYFWSTRTWSQGIWACFPK